MEKLKIAIIGGGIAGLSCAHECERLGVTAEVFERHHSPGWIWPSISSWLDIFTRYYSNEPLKYIKDNYGINIKSAVDEKVFIMKSPNAEARIEGNLGISLYRGKEPDALDQQLLRELRRTPVYFNSLSNYKELAKKYDYVVIASGRDQEAKELGVWEEHGRVSIIGSIALGKFTHHTSTIYFDTEYTGSGYARLSPFSDSEAILCIYIINKAADFKLQQLDVNRNFERFLEKEKLDNLEMMYRFIKPPFSTGKVSKFQVGKILLAGRSAGLTDRLLGTGGMEAIISGVSAARAIIKGEDYEKTVKPLQDHIESISAFRNIIDKFDNDKFDKMVTLLGTPGVKQLVYNTHIRFPDLVGNVLSKIDH